MVVLVTCKNEEEPVKNGASVLKTSYIIFFRRSRADNSGVGGGIWPKFELIQAVMHVLVTCTNEDDSIKNKGARMVTKFPLISLWRFFQTLKGSLLCSPWSDLAEFRTRSRCNGCSCYLQE